MSSSSEDETEEPSRITEEKVEPKTILSNPFGVQKNSGSRLGPSYSLEVQVASLRQLGFSTFTSFKVVYKSV